MTAKNFRVYLGFCPNRHDPSPPPRTLGHQKKLCLFCILGYSKHIFFMKKSHFFGLGLGNPTPYCDKIPTQSPCGFGLKKLGLGQTPAPLVGTKSQVNPKICSTGSPYCLRASTTRPQDSTMYENTLFCVLEKLGLAIL